MIPSSRTPEGEPLRCQICGALHNVETSTPPGDSVCPSCGSHSWIARRFDVTETTRREIRTFVGELSVRCRQELPLKHIGNYLVTGLVRSLAAHGASLWTAGNRKWWSRQATLKLTACVGERESSDFAHEVSLANRDIMRNETIAGRATLLIGVPVMCNNKVMGVIEVIQRAGSPPNSQKGYLRFVMQMADIFAACPALQA